MKHARLRVIGVIGDVHAEHDHLYSALQFLHQHAVDAIVCTGDIADGGGDINRCCDLLRKARALTVRGNHDRWLLTNRVRHIEDATPESALSASTRQFLEALPVSLTLFTEMGPMLLCHGMLDKDLRKIWPGTERMPPERSDELDTLIAEQAYRLIVNGHMHYRCLVHFDALTLMNAGTLKPRHRPGFSILDTAAREVTAFEFGANGPQAVSTQGLLPGGEDRVWRNTAAFDGQWQPKVLYSRDPAS